MNALAQTKSPAAISRLTHGAGVVLFFSALTMFLYSDIVRSISSLVQAGQHVGGFFTWLFWWWSYALKNGLPLFHTPFQMYPGGTYIFPHDPLDEILGIALQVFVSPFAAYNIVQLWAHVSTAVAMYWFLYQSTKQIAASLWGGFAYAFSHYCLVQHYLGHMGSATLFFNPLLAFAVLRFFDVPQPRRAFWVALTFLGTILTGPYTGFSFGVIFLAAAAVYDFFYGKKQLLVSRVGSMYALAVLAPLIVAAFVYWPLLRYSGQWIGGHYASCLSLGSFFEPPFWHRSAFVQAIRPLKNGAGYTPEEAMAYLGLATWGLLLWVWTRKKFMEPRFRFWGFLLLSSFILTLGPWLTIVPGRRVFFPLPYLLIQHLPVLSTFRNPGRILMTLTFASSVISALALKTLLEKKPRALQIGAALLLIVFTILELDMRSVQKRRATLFPSQAYKAIKEDTAKFAIMELPLFYDENGDLNLTAYLYLLYQPYHQRPMVLGSPSRYLRSALNFTETTDVVYELTHPWVLGRIGEDPASASRGAWLARNASKKFHTLGIKYVLYHTRDPIITNDTHRLYRVWLNKMFGPPIVEDEQGIQLFLADRGK